MADGGEIDIYGDDIEPEADAAEMDIYGDDIEHEFGEVSIDGRGLSACKTRSNLIILKRNVTFL